MLNILVGLFALSVSLNSTVVSAESNAERYDACVKAASKEYVEFDQLEAATAIPLCQAAVAQIPDSGELMASLARAFLKSEQYSEAFFWGNKSAQMGHYLGQFNLAWMYSTGTGVSQSDVEAVRLYRLSAEQDFVFAQSNLGWMYLNGRGVTQSDTEAFQWYQLAAEQGLAGGQNTLGWMYSSGRGVVRNNAKAIRYFRLAANQGNAGAQNNLGVAYENGDLLAEDLSIALQWYQRAADQDYDGAEEAVERVSEKIRNEQIGDVLGDIAIDVGTELLKCWLLDEC